jgi:arabinan endo-1,5-alpha-L-arabinosidase
MMKVSDNDKVSRLLRTRRPLRVLVILTTLAAALAGLTTSASAATQQPVDTHSMPDPGVYLYDGHFYAFTTGGFGLWESTASAATGPWTAPADVLNHSAIPAWIQQSGGIWAPDVVRLPSGGWVVYFAAVLNPSSGTGLEKPASGESGTGQSTIRMVRLNVDNGTSVLGVSHQLLAAIPTGPGGTYQFSDTIEAPSMLALSDGWFIMFVAHGNYDSCSYSTEWYKTQHPWSWNQTPVGTVLSQGEDGLCGPGTADITSSEVSGQYRLFFNAYTSGTPGTTRELYADRVTIGSDGYTPTLNPLAPAT